MKGETTQEGGKIKKKWITQIKVNRMVTMASSYNESDIQQPGAIRSKREWACWKRSCTPTPASQKDCRDSKSLILQLHPENLPSESFYPL